MSPISWAFVLKDIVPDKANKNVYNCKVFLIIKDGLINVNGKY